MSSTSGACSFTVALADERATERLTQDIAGLIEPGDLITLSGGLGAGKTTFARALIRHLAGDETLEVPSPTFTLMQSYDLPRFTLIHGDLFRVDSPDELIELGLDDPGSASVTLIEWPDRADGLLPADRIDLALKLDTKKGMTFRAACVSGYGRLAARVERMAAIRDFLAQAGFGDVHRLRIQGDASTRSYERLTREGVTYILMNSPRRTDGPPVRDGKPYSAIAHLAEDITPFLAMTHGLRALGLSAPAIFAADRGRGLAILEDLGSELVVDGDPPAPVEARYETAVDLLATLHAQNLPDTLSVETNVTYSLPRYDMDAFLIEAELLPDWYLPRLGRAPGETAKEAYRRLWRAALEPIVEAGSTWVLRDFHSPNLLWLPEREGIARLGVLDFQDALVGPAAYDVASLLQDARVDVPETLEIALLSRYTRTRMRTDPGFDAAEFARTYATLAAQRASKILGIFARLDARDGKPQYLRHLPRVATYLQRALAHPALADLADWYRGCVPALRSI